MSNSSFVYFPWALHMNHYTRGPLLNTLPIDQAFASLELEKKICRSSFRYECGQHMPKPTSIRIRVGRLNKGPVIDSSRWAAARKRPWGRSQQPSPTVASLDLDEVQQRNAGQPSTSLPVLLKPAPLASLAFTPASLAFGLRAKGARAKGASMSAGAKRAKDKSPYQELNAPRKVNKLDKNFIHSGVLLANSDWVLEQLVNQIENKRTVRGVVHAAMRDAESLFGFMQSASPVVGFRITATGRLSKKKKAMAQQMTKSIGKVPLGTFRQKVGYSQGWAVTKFGVVGLKVWIAFA